MQPAVLIRRVQWLPCRHPYGQVWERRIEIWSSAKAVYVGNHGSTFRLMHVFILLLLLLLFHSLNSDIFLF